MHTNVEYPDASESWKELPGYSTLIWRSAVSVWLYRSLSVRSESGSENVAEGRIRWQCYLRKILIYRFQGALAKLTRFLGPRMPCWNGVIRSFGACVPSSRQGNTPVSRKMLDHDDVRLSLQGTAGRCVKGTPRTSRGGRIDQASQFIRS